jgi:EAL domain-containing protein (putative c-di-GMP-specific phosphodiesterase class I)
MEKYNVHFHAGIYHIENPNITCEKAVLRASSGNNYAEKNSVPFSFSDEGLLKREEYEQNLRKKLSQAINNDEFKLYVQYIFDAGTDYACGAEVLSRWHNPENGIIYPSDYIELLETANLIDSLDYSIIENSCRLLEEWSGGKKSNLWISCNLTRTTLSKDDFTQRFGEILDKYKFDREKFVIEITEDMLASDSETAVKNIIACKKMGVRIALDDFGNGYSSVRDLCDYPIDIIKVDRGIVEKSLTQRGDSLLRGVIKLAHYLNTLVLCEGVENREELDEAKAAGCDFVQGFVFSKVYPANEPSIDKLIRFAPNSTIPAPRPVAKPTAQSRPARSAAKKPTPPPAPKQSANPTTAQKPVVRLSYKERRRQEKLQALLDKFR